MKKVKYMMSFINLVVKYFYHTFASFPLYLGSYSRKKSLLPALYLLLVFFFPIGLASCSNDDATSTQDGDTTSRGNPTAPNFSYGEYMYSKLSNVVFYLDSERCLALKFKDIENYKAFDVASPECVTNVKNYVDYGITGMLVWHPYINDISAYKLTINATDYYVYQGLFGPEIRMGNSSTGTSLKRITDKNSFTLPADGTYISYSSTSSASAKITIDNEQKYLYAVVAEDGKKITFYLDDSDSVTDFTSLRPYGTLTDLNYGFVSIPGTEAIKDDWTIEHANSTLKVTKKNVISSVTLKKNR